MKRAHWLAVLSGLLVFALAPAALAVPRMLGTHHGGVGRSQQIRLIRQATDEFHNIAEAEDAGYGAFKDINGVSCIDMPDMPGMKGGAMGVHFVNPNLVGDPNIDPSKPEALVYAPERDGTLRLAAVEFIVDKATWDAKNAAPPLLFPGHPFNVTTAPNRYGLNTFYSQHVWAWKSNPSGQLSMWNPSVHCAWA
ncbi:hypothetical protein M6D93_01270 [Jatrophihabitans telluris]|uniref:Uncharacterized protein n=1 Tax=Jatrophihabitans telluris TaxID=2038343 RepID=A0ABY4QY99_9ACTN|nr:hypothetical protein [Jatrophihabitans telluris]UQX88646.1 hypothetical protein M6D93_01270 [Jatrophihabitans telluris]